MNRHLVLLVLLLAPAIAAAEIVEHETYAVGDSVPLNIPTASDPVRIIIDAPDGRFRMLDSAPAPFTPRAPGNHTVTILTLDGDEIARDAFVATQPKGAVHVSDDPRAGEPVIISISPAPAGPVDITIRSAGGIFRYTGPWVDSPFTPKEAGPHEIAVRQGDTAIGQLSFTVGPARESAQSEAGAAGTITIGEKDSEGRETRRQARLLRKRTTPDGELYDIEIEPNQRVARRVVIHDLQVNASITAGIDEVPADAIRETRLRRTGPVLKAFAIDLGGLNFTDALVTGVAQGTALHKCALWDYAAQSCRGSWTKIMDLVPGREYTITLTPGDPGYAETGVATINSRKPIYLPNETAELLIAVLDTGGFLVSDANVTLTVTAPDGANATLSTDTGQIIEIDRGVYRAYYGSTALIGNYTLVVDATAPGVQSAMGSSFAVMTDHPFDILRDAPVTTDPFLGPFDASITVVPRIDAGEYNLTEVLPAEFGIVEATGAAVSGDSASTYLAWSGLSRNATVSYTAQPPLDTPALFALGKAFVTYVQAGVVRVFEELRAWLLAIDPEVARDQGLVVYGDQTDDGIVKQRNWTGSLLEAEENSVLDFGNRLTWLKFRCSRARPECLLLVSDGGNDLNFAVFNTLNWTWHNSTQLDGAIGQDNQMQFDLECEDLSGDCLLAYEDTTTGDATFQARTWNASGLQSAQTITITGAESFDFRWIRLYPQKGTDRIGIALQNDGGGANGDTPAIYAGIWNGTNFTDWRTLTTNGPSASTSSRTQFSHYDCGWEGNTSRFLCVYGNNSVNGVLMDRWNGTWSYVGNVYSATGDEVWEFAVCGQEPWGGFAHDDVGLMFCDDGADLDGGIWNGTNFSKTATTQIPAANTNAECGPNKAQDQWARNFECRWEQSGDQAVFVWVAANGNNFLTAGTYTRSTGAFSMANWSTGTQVVATGAGDLRFAQLIPNQDSDKIFLVYSDASRDGGCSDWTGTSWDGSGCNGQAVFETNGARPARQWITFDWFRTPPPQPDITIYQPNGTRTLINYSGVLNPSSTSVAAENLTTTAQPPAGTSAPLPGTEFPSAAYVNISASDDQRRHTVVTTTGGRRATQIFNFSVADSPISMDQITITHEGRATQTVSQTAGNFRIYAYNWTSDAYVLERTVFASSVDVLTEVSIASGFTDYVRNRQLLLLVQGEFATGGGANARAEVITDFIGLTIDSRAVLRANTTVNASAEDDDGIAFCEWGLVNVTSGAQVGNLSPLPLSASPFYVNVNDTRLYPDGEYDLTVFCNDTLDNRRNATETVRIDNTAPGVVVYTIANNTNLSVSYAVFSWNATDIFGENLLCNVTIGTSVAASNVVSAHGENTTRNITGIADGPHNWTITCADDAGNTNTTGMRNFTADTVPPALSLAAPATGAFINSTTVNFTYTPSDANGLANCTLRLDSVDNSTTTTPASGVTANFTIPGVNEGLHWWNVTCYDNFAKSNLSATRNFTLDATPPTIFLNTSNGITFNNTPASLNFTAFDNIDANLTCNVSVNSTIVATNIGGPNGTLVSVSVDLEDGDKAWNVTCADDAGNVNVSQTRFFRMIGGPFVQLQLPRNNTVGNGLNVNFTYYVQDGDGVSNCSLVVDDILNQTNSSVTNQANNSFLVADISPGGYHAWYVNCTDTSGTVGNTDPYTLVVDRTPPDMILNLPGAGQTLTVTPTRLNFTLVDDLSPNATCNLTIDGSVAAANKDFIALNATLTARSQTVINGLHYWNVTCADLGGNANTSLTRNFTVNATFPLSVTVVADKETYQEGELALINITVRNESSLPVAANGTLDLIFTNATATDVPWWNTSWARRKPISINETSNVARTNKPVAVNITGLLGSISSCSAEIRVIRDSDLAEMAFNVIDGDDVTYCYVQFNASVAANQNNQQDYHVYYNNSGAASPGYANLTATVTLFSDNFADAGLGGWTADAGWDRSTNDPLSGGHAHVDGSVTDAAARMSASVDTSGYDSANLSFRWGIDGAWDAGEYIHLEFSNDSAVTWSGNVTSIFGGTGAIEETRSFILNASYSVAGFNLRYQATVSAAGEDGGFDDVDITAQNALQNVSAWSGGVQLWLGRNQTDTNATGNASANVTTLGKQEGNYSVVARHTNPTGANSAGTGWDWFRIISDVFGPQITLVDPANQSTNHSGQITFVYLATDANDIMNCTITIDGAVNGTNSTPINESGNNTHLAALPEGQHTWQVNCTDNLDNNASSGISTFFLDDTPPDVTALSPNATTLGTPNVTFSFNATDNLDTLLECTINLSGPSPRNISVSAANASNTTATAMNLSDGSYAWNVTCLDNINNTFTTGTATFAIDSAPVVSLFSPPDDYGVNATGIALFYNVTETAIANCTLYLNGTANQSNSTPLLYTSNDGNNNFTIDVQYGRYNWTVTCWDINNFSGSGPTWRFQLDNDVPDVTLNRPLANETLFSTTVTFNWTILDTDPSPTCNLTLDGTENQTGIPANESVPTLRAVTGLTAGNHSWNVTCWDGTGFTNYSETRNFTIDGTVRVTLVSPANNSIDGDGTVAFTYVPESISGFTLGFCDIYLDSVSNNTHIGLTSGAQDTFTVNGIDDGSHGWYINCTDSVGAVGISDTRAFITDLQDPAVTPHGPNGTAFAVSTVTFNWTATDNLDLNLTCDVRVNGTLQSPGSINSPNATVTNATYSGFTDGLFLWNVTCTDDGQRNGTSAIRNFTIQEPPTVNLNAPSAGNRTRNQTIMFSYTPNDNANAIGNCTLVIDGTVNATNTSVNEGIANNFTIGAIPEGFHAWNVTCLDPSGNAGENVSGRNFTIDLTPPSINLTYPPNASFINGNNITFNWTPADTSAPTITCNISVTNGTGALNGTGITGANGTVFGKTFADLAEGPHNWSVTCVDDVGNSNTSATFSFTINQPDLQTNDTQLSVNSTNPALSETILVRANVTNIGGVPANGFVVAFWDGPTNIGNATGTLAPNASAILNVSWNATPGYHALWAIVDPDNAINELLETNNNGSLNISAINVNVTYPPNASVTSDSTPEIHFNITDYTAGNLGYAVFVDGVANGQNGTVAADSNTTLSASPALADGYRRIIVQANDSLGRYRNSTPRTIIIDTTPPNGTFVTPNGTFFQSGTFNVTVRLNDTLDTDINYTIYVDGTRNASGNVTNATSTNVTLADFAEGVYALTLEGLDWAGNAANNTPIVIYVDATPPVVTLIAPQAGADFPSRSVNLSYNVTDNLDPVLACDLSLDGSNVDSANVSNGANRTYAASGLSEGTHLWNATCWDGAAGQVNNAATSSTRNFTVSIAPNITLIAPANSTVTSNGTRLFTFNVTDETGLSNCSIIVNGAINQTKTTGQLTLNGTNNFTVSGMNNTILWAITCTDNSTGFAAATSETRTLYVDLVQPVPTINTADGSWFSTPNATLNITITDNLDTVINWSFFVDSAVNSNGTATNGTATLANLSGVPDGQHTIILQASDDAGNYANSSGMVIFIDTQAPNVTLLSPANDTNLSTTIAFLNFTATDNLANVIACDLSLDGGVVQQYNLTNGTVGNHTTGSLASGYHSWNVTCIDNATNTRVSDTWRFFIQLPDLVITGDNITASNTTPVENQTIVINATIFNLGQINATNITVQFWRGDPDAGGTQLGANQTVAVLGIGANATLSINYTTIVGANSIYVVVDPPTAAGGLINETNETNNKASLSFLVGIYQVFAGGSANELHISDDTLIAAFTWNETNVTGSNVFVADTDSAIAFGALLAIGRNTTNGTSVGTNDFDEIDTELGTGGINESVNNTWTSGGQPVRLENVTIFARRVVDIPTVNSTNTTSFRTGILWDSADANPGSYNGSQDIVFITIMNQSRTGQYGTYDYEIKVPAPLRDYIAGGGTVTFYTEIR